MALPNVHDVQIWLLRLLAGAPNGCMEAKDTYAPLAQRFPEIAEDELTMPYGNSISQWVNRVQFARMHLVAKGWILPPALGGGRGRWTVSEAGRASLAEIDRFEPSLLTQTHVVGADLELPHRADPYVD